MLKKLCELEAENHRLRRMYANAQMDNEVLKEALTNAELQNLHQAANKVCKQIRSGVTLTLLCNPHWNERLRNISEVTVASLLQEVRKPNGHKLASLDF